MLHNFNFNFITYHTLGKIHENNQTGGLNGLRKRLKDLFDSIQAKQLESCSPCYALLQKVIDP